MKFDGAAFQAKDAIDPVDLRQLIPDGVFLALERQILQLAVFLFAQAKLDFPRARLTAAVDRELAANLHLSRMWRQPPSHGVEFGARSSTTQRIARLLLAALAALEHQVALDGTLRDAQLACGGAR